MNVLIFVTVLLMVLASLSYTEIKIFYRQALTQAAWGRYMDTVEGCLFDKKLDDIYSLIPKTKEDKTPKLDSLGHKQEDEDRAPTQKTQSTGSRLINFRFLLGQIDNNEVANQFRGVIKNLISDLYKDAVFYKTLQAKRPDFIDDLLNALKEQYGDEKTKKASEIQTFSLQDPELNEAFYFLTKPHRDESNDKSACEEISILDFFMDTYRTQIRVYLAPPEILLAVFKDPQTVNQILKERQNLYKKVKKGMPPAEAGELFRQKFEGHSPFHNILDFTVTKTNPASYK